MDCEHTWRIYVCQELVQRAAACSSAASEVKKDLGFTLKSCEMLEYPTYHNEVGRKEKT